MPGSAPGGVLLPFSVRGGGAPEAVGPKSDVMLGIVRSSADDLGGVDDGAEVVRGRFDGGSVVGAFVDFDDGSEEYCESPAGLEAPFVV